MYKSKVLKLLCIVLVVMFSANLSAKDYDRVVLQNLNRLARNMHSAYRSEPGSKEAMQAIAREATSIDAMKALVVKVDSPEDIERFAGLLRQYAYRIRNSSERRAFDESVSQLEARVKYLALTEDPSYSSHVGMVSALRREFANAGSKDRSVAKRAQKISTQAGASRQVPDELLGAHVKDGKTHFSVYSPAATSVKLAIFKKATDKTGQNYEMTKDNYGVWHHSLEGALFGVYYGYYVDGPKTAGHLFNPKTLLSDPYAFANYNHDGKSIVVDRTFKWSSNKFKRPAHKDMIVYEMHIKDFTAHGSSGVKAPHKNNYLGVLQGKGTGRVLGHLKELGVNAIEVLPVHEFDNNFAGVTNHWGYMTSHFFAPEISYASGKSGEAVKEFKMMVDGLHNEGFAVIMDVVFNHTAEGDHRGLPLNFKGFDNPGYYRLMDNRKFYWNGSGCGNEFHSQNPMTQKLILDSLKYWTNEYKIDGFRFDLGTLIDKGTMQRIIDELPQDIFLTAEPWAADWNRNLWGKSDFRNTRLSKWNDDYREAIRGFVEGNASRNDVMTVLAGSSFWWTAKPTESLNYLEAHDGYTLNDLWKGDKKKTRLAAIALLTSQGIPMIHAGQEFNRSKGGNHNSYDQDNETNWINWQEKRQNRDIFDLYSGLIALRHKYPNFKHAVALNNQHIEWIQPANQRGIGMFLKGKDNFAVLLNGDPEQWVEFRLPSGGAWKVVCDGERVNDSGLYTAEGTYNVPPTTGIILRK